MENQNSPGETLSIKDINSVEGLLQALRSGNTSNLAIGLGPVKVPVRLISASEEMLLITQAKATALKKNPTGVKVDLWESYHTMLNILGAATTINGANSFPMGFLEELTRDELANLYDEYVSITNTINPNMKDLTPDQFQAIVDSVKKKRQSSKDFYMYQLAAIGKSFLDAVEITSQTASAPGLP